MLTANQPALLSSQLDVFLDSVRDHVEEQHSDIPTDSWELDWHIYGRDESGNLSSQVCLIGEARAATQELATSIAATAKVANIHGPYSGQKATSGNLSHGIGGVYTIPLGKCAEFCVYHLMDLKPGEERGGPGGPLFRIHSTDIRRDHVGRNGAAETTEPTQNGQSEVAKKAVTRRKLDLSVTPLTAVPDNPTLGDIAKVVRSKNSGPYEITVDVIFELPAVFYAVKNANILSPDIVAQLFGIATDQVIWSGFFDQALAYKATIPRIRGGKCATSGGFLEDDVHGSQMYMPLLQLKLPRSLGEEIRGILTKDINGGM